MPQVQLNDNVFLAAERKARADGYASVDLYVADLLADDLAEVTENLDHLFTPERISELDGIVQALDQGGKRYTLEEVDAHFEEKRQKWAENHQN